MDRHPPISRRLCLKTTRPLDEGGDLFDTDAASEVSETGRPITPHLLRVTIHDAEVGADQGRQIDLITVPAFERDLCGTDVETHNQRRIVDTNAKC